MNSINDDKENGTIKNRFPWETIPVFISSTFNDMHGERDYLVKEVFPELRDWCEERKLRLVDIDLRWGVTETDATRNKNVVQVCLDRIDGARPFFLCFLGQRYGWVPKNDEIAQNCFSNFAGLEQAVKDNSSVTEMEVLHALLEEPFDRSTGNRIPAEHAFFYLRDSKYTVDIPNDPPPLKRIYTDAVEPDSKSNKFLTDKQFQLRSRLEKQLDRQTPPYTATWNPDARTPELKLPMECPSIAPENRKRWRKQWDNWAGVKTTEEAVTDEDREKAKRFNEQLCGGRLEKFECNGDSLGEIIFEDLKEAILKRYPDRKDPPVQDDLELEIDRHEDFVRTATDVFIERAGDFSKLDEYASGREKKLFALLAPAGTGKSTLLGGWIQHYRSRERRSANETVHVRFIGVSEESSTVDALMRSILSELHRDGKLSSDIPDNPNVLRMQFGTLLRSVRGSTTIVIDALNQLQSGPQDTSWLLQSLSQAVSGNAKVIISCKVSDENDGEFVERLRNDEKAIVSDLKPFSAPEDRRALVTKHLEQYLKELDDGHMEALIQTEGTENPLFLKIILSELRVFGAFGQLKEKIERHFGTTPKAAFTEVLRRLEEDHGQSTVPLKKAVPLLFGLLSRSKGGLPEELLIRALVEDFERQGTSYEDIRSLVRVILRQMRPFLARREGRTDFFYESLYLAAKNRYTTTAAISPVESADAQWHARIAKIANQWRDEMGNHARQYSLKNLVHHKIESGDIAGAATDLTDLEYLYRRLEESDGSTVYEIEEEMNSVLRRLPSEHSLQNNLLEWERFWRERTHEIRRKELGICPETTFLSLAISYAENSNISRAAEQFVSDQPPKKPWLRPVRRPQNPETSACIRTLEGHTGFVSSVATSPDGRLVVSGGSGELIVWESATGKALHRIPGRNFESVTISNDGTRLATAGLQVQVWNLNPLSEIATIKPERPGGLKIALHPTGQYLACGGNDDVKIWDLEGDAGSCRTIESKDDIHGRVQALAFYPDGQRIIVSRLDVTNRSRSCFRVWGLQAETSETTKTTLGRLFSLGRARENNSNEGTLQTAYQGEPRFHDPVVALLPDGERVVSGNGLDGRLEIWSLVTGQSIRVLREKGPNVNAIAVTADGRHFVVAAGASYEPNQSLELWEIESGTLVNEIHFRGPWLRAAAFADRGRIVVTAHHDGTVRIWDLNEKNTSNEVTNQKDRKHLLSIKIDDFAGRVASAGGSGTVDIYSTDNGQRICELASQAGWTTCLDLNADHKRVACGTQKGTVIEWDVTSGEKTSEVTIGDLKTWVKFVQYLPQTDTLVCCARDEVSQWNLAAREKIRTINCDETLRGMLVHPDEQRVITCGENREVKVWRLESGTLIHKLPGYHGDRNNLRLSPCREYLFAPESSQVNMWNLKTGKAESVFAGTKSSVRGIALSSDGKTLVSFHEDRNVRVWDVESGRCLHTLKGHQQELSSIALSPDSRWIASVEGDVNSSRFGKLLVWNIQKGNCAAGWRTANAVMCCAMTNRHIAIGTAGHEGELLQFEFMAPPGQYFSPMGSKRRSGEG